MNWRQDTTLSDPEQACMWDSEYKAAQVSRTDFSNADQHPCPLAGQTPRHRPNGFDWTILPYDSPEQLNRLYAVELPILMTESMSNKVHGAHQDQDS